MTDSLTSRLTDEVLREAFNAYKQAAWDAAKTATPATIPEQFAREQRLAAEASRAVLVAALGPHEHKWLTLDDGLVGCETCHQRRVRCRCPHCGGDGHDRATGPFMPEDDPERRPCETCQGFGTVWAEAPSSPAAPLVSPPGPPTWMPRETAPENGSAFRAYGPTLIHADFNPWGQVEACYDGERFVGAVWDGQFDQWNTVEIEFTHWQPFPQSPVTPKCGLHQFASDTGPCPDCDALVSPPGEAHELQPIADELMQRMATPCSLCGQLHGIEVDCSNATGPSVAAICPTCGKATRACRCWTEDKA